MSQKSQTEGAAPPDQRGWREQEQPGQRGRRSTQIYNKYTHKHISTAAFPISKLFYTDYRTSPNFEICVIVAVINNNLPCGG